MKKGVVLTVVLVAIATISTILLGEEKRQKIEKNQPDYTSRVPKHVFSDRLEERDKYCLQISSVNTPINTYKVFSECQITVRSVESTEFQFSMKNSVSIVQCL